MKTLSASRQHSIDCECLSFIHKNDFTVQQHKMSIIYLCLIDWVVHQSKSPCEDIFGCASYFAICGEFLRMAILFRFKKQNKKDLKWLCFVTSLPNISGMTLCTSYVTIFFCDKIEMYYLCVRELLTLKTK